MSRSFETLLYCIAATILVGACLYGLALSVDSPAPPAPTQAVYAPPQPAARPAVPPAPLSSQLPPAAAQENVVRTATKTYYLTPASPAQTDVDTYNTLRNNCYANASGNREGEFPALQQAACDRFAAFARSRGWSTGQLPAYGTPRPREVGDQVTVIGRTDAVDQEQCAGLYSEEQSIEAEMRAGYREPRGNWLRERKREVEEQLWRLHCPRR